MEATSVTPRFLPYRIKATGEVGVFDSVTERWAPFDMNTNRHRSSAVSMNTHGPEIIPLFWFNKGEVHL